MRTIGYMLWLNPYRLKWLLFLKEYSVKNIALFKYLAQKRRKNENQKTPKKANT